MNLSEDARAVILLNLEGLSEREIPDVMNCATGTVRSRRFPGRAELGRLLSAYEQLK